MYMMFNDPIHHILYVCPQLNLAVCYEVTLQHEESLHLYQEAAVDLEAAVSLYCSSKDPPNWLKKIQEAPCESWDYPKLAWHHLTWRVRRHGEEGDVML